MNANDYKQKLLDRMFRDPVDKSLDDMIEGQMALNLITEIISSNATFETAMGFASNQLKKMNITSKGAYYAWLNAERKRRKL